MVGRVALTGGIATGKSHVRARFEKLGVPTIDSDVLAREVVAPGTPGLAAVVARFGPDILRPDGTLDRKTIARLVFADTDARLALERIIHPEVRVRTERFFEQLDPAEHPFAIADIPLLYEVGRDRDFEKVVVAACDPAMQIRRIVERDGISEDEARQRVGAQLPIGEKVGRADYVIRTDGTFDETAKQVDDVFVSLATAYRLPPTA